MPAALPTRALQADQRLRELGIKANAIHAKGMDGNNPYAKQTDNGRAYIWCNAWKPEELEAIAAHMRANQ